MSVNVRKVQIARVMPRERQRRPDGRRLADLMRPGERPSERRPSVTEAHIPVMVDEVLHLLAPRPDAVFVDATVGAGGHAEAILRAAGGRLTLVGIDRDEAAIDWAAHRLSEFGEAVRLARAGFDELEWVLESMGLGAAQGVLLDLGMSSMQVDDASRGFSFRKDGPLDMRMDTSQRLTAADVVNTYTEADLVRILREFGEERNAGRVARAIVTSRRRGPVRTTHELAQIVMDAYPAAGRRGTHPARKTFQAVRIEVNDELGMLERALRSAVAALAPGGRIVVLSYHSLEDRMTKRVFSELAGPEAAIPGLGAPTSDSALRVLTRGALMPSDAEVERNPRASSARLRAAERTS